jgi:hypothetical protein
MRTIALALLFVAAFGVALGATLPMSFVAHRLDLQNAGVSADEISGSVWNARIRRAHYRGLTLGDVEASLDPVSVLGGTRRVAIRAAYGRFTLLEGNMRGIESADLTIPVQRLPILSSFAGDVAVESGALVFADGRCVRAAGRLVTDVMRRAFAGPTLSGAISCGDGVAAARLEGRTADMEVRTALELDADGGYRAETQVMSSDPRVRAMLALAGFVEMASGFVRSDEGVFGS